MRRSNRNFNIPPTGRKPQAFELLKIESFKFSAPRAKMLFKCPTLSSDFVCQMPLLKNNRRQFLSVMKLGYDHCTQITRIQREKWKQTLQGEPCVMCLWQIARKSPRILPFFANFFSVWDMNEYCTVAVCHNGSKKRPERVSGNYHSKFKGPREILDSSVTSPG